MDLRKIKPNKLPPALAKGLMPVDAISPAVRVYDGGEVVVVIDLRKTVAGGVVPFSVHSMPATHPWQEVRYSEGQKINYSNRGPLGSGEGTILDARRPDRTGRINYDVRLADGSETVLLLEDINPILE